MRHGALGLMVGKPRACETTFYNIWVCASPSLDPIAGEFPLWSLSLGPNFFLGLKKKKEQVRQKLGPHVIETNMVLDTPLFVRGSGPKGS